MAENPDALTDNFAKKTVNFGSQPPARPQRLRLPVAKVPLQGRAIPGGAIEAQEVRRIHLPRGGTMYQNPGQLKGN